VNRSAEPYANFLYALDPPYPAARPALSSPQSAASYARRRTAQAVPKPSFGRIDSCAAWLDRPEEFGGVLHGGMLQPASRERCIRLQSGEPEYHWTL